ncbi:hypothetical protein ACH4MM_18195 [Streptomyces pratensis]|uniref:hypothetical protein n=1 Tax=Streptomyces pratensis TaxID=1169025 RepID=UPI0037BA011D
MDDETHHPAEPVADHVTCVRCGSTWASDVPPATWLCSVEDGGRQYVCEDCARDHIRAIESRLDSEWW